MFKVYENIRTVTIPANVQGLGFAIKVGTHFGCLKRLVVKQTDSSNLQSFTVNVYSLPVVALVAGQSPPYSTTLPLDAFKIMPQQTATAGNAVEVFASDWGYPFINRFTGLAQPTRELYVHIQQGSTPTSPTNWVIAFTVLVAG